MHVSTRGFLGGSYFGAVVDEGVEADDDVGHGIVFLIVFETGTESHSPRIKWRFATSLGSTECNPGAFYVTH